MSAPRPVDGRSLVLGVILGAVPLALLDIVLHAVTGCQ